MKIGDRVRVVDSRRSYHENGQVGVVAEIAGDTVLVEFPPDTDALYDFAPDELEYHRSE